MSDDARGHRRGEEPLLTPSSAMGVRLERTALLMVNLS